MQVWRVRCGQDAKFLRRCGSAEDEAWMTQVKSTIDDDNDRSPTLFFIYMQNQTPMQSVSVPSCLQA